MEERTRRLSTCWVPPVLLLLIGRLSSAVSTAEFPVRLQDNGTVSISAVAPSKELKVNAGASTADTLTVLGNVHATGGVFVDGEPAATNKNSMLVSDVPMCHEPGTDAMLGLPTGGFECDCLEGWSGTTCDVSAESARARIRVGYEFTCTILSNNNKVKCWGKGSDGQLGYADRNFRGDGPNEMGDNLPYVDVGTGRTVKEISTGSTSYHTCAILDNDKLKCWGSNSYGRLGYGDITMRGAGPNDMGDNLPYVDVGTGRTVKQISVGSLSTCALLDNDKLKCWGHPPLGYGDGCCNLRGDGPNEMGDNLPYVDVGTGRTIKQISAGSRHTCAILDNDKLKCWGSNSYGRLGYGDTTMRGAGPNDMGDNLLYVDLGTGRTVKQISAGSVHTCAILDDYKLKCWGWNEYGRLGYGDTTTRGDLPNSMGDNLPYVDVGTGRTVKQISAGELQTCAILDNDKVKCWGRNDGGQLGYGDTNNRGDGYNEMGDNLPYVDVGTGRTVKQIAAGSGLFCALLDNDAVKCWGRNSWGQLGYGDTTTRGRWPNDMGDNLPEVDLGSA